MRKNCKRCARRAAGFALALLLAMSIAACGSGSGSGSGTAGSGADGKEDALQEETTSSGESMSSGEGAFSGQSTADNGENASADQPQEEAADEGEIEIPEVPYTREDGGVNLNVFAMDTYMTLLAYGDRAEEAVLAAAAEIHRLDDMLSTGNPESEISLLNAAGTGYVSDVVLELVEKSGDLYTETGGLFDIAIYPVVKLWGFPTQEYRVPAKEEIREALKLADASAVKVQKEGADAAASAEAAETAETAETADTEAGKDTAAAGKTTKESATEKTGAAGAAGAAAENADAAQTGAARIDFGMKGMAIDLGGIAKGFTSSRVMEIYKEYGIEHGLVSLGGNVQALGVKEDGSAWRVAIQNPESDLDYLGILEIDDKCVITSGGYERYFVEDGVRYHHIIDPRTGYPADSGLISSTIISDDGTLADGLSTSLFVMGKDEAEKYWRAHPGTFDYILEDADGTLYVTKGAADLLTTEAKTVIVQ